MIKITTVVEMRGEDVALKTQALGSGCFLETKAARAVMDAMAAGAAKFLESEPEFSANEKQFTEVLAIDHEREKALYQGLTHLALTGNHSYSPAECAECGKIRAIFEKKAEWQGADRR